MTEQALKYINDRLTEAGINYHFARYQFGGDAPEYPYAVGTYNEAEATTEDGLQETTLTLDCWTRGSWADLERVKARVKATFPPTGDTTILSTGSGVAVSYARTLTIPTGEAELKRIEITLNIKEWSVN